MNIPTIVYEYYVDTYRTVITMDGDIVLDCSYAPNEYYLMATIDPYNLLPSVCPPDAEWHPAHNIPRSAGCLMLHHLLMAHYGRDTLYRWYEEYPLSLSYSVLPHETYQGYTLEYGHFTINETKIDLTASIVEAPYAFGAFVDQPYGVQHQCIDTFSTLLGMAAIGMWLSNHNYFNSEEYRESAFPSFVDNSSPITLTMTIPSLRSLINYRGQQLFPEKWYDPIIPWYRPSF